MAHPQTSFTLKLDTAYMEVPRCESCKHWTHESGVLGRCCLLVHGSYARDIGVSRLAIADDDEHDAKFVTRDSFGCVQWEAH